MHKNIDYESLLSFVQDNPNAGISLTISENEFDQVIETIISALITNETPPTQLVIWNIELIISILNLSTKQRLK